MKKLTIILSICFIFVKLCFADSVLVSWSPNPETDISGYKVYYKNTTTGLTSSVQSTNAFAVVSGLNIGVTYIFYVTAWNTANLESDPSDSVTRKILLQFPGTLLISD
jgi:hypothetical protein